MKTVEIVAVVAMTVAGVYLVSRLMPTPDMLAWQRAEDVVAAGWKPDWSE